MCGATCNINNNYRELKMPRTFKPHQKCQKLKFYDFFNPIAQAMIDMPQLSSRGNRPLQMTFQDHLKALVYFHLEEHHSAQHLLQVLKEDDFARNEIAPKDGIEKRRKGGGKRVSDLKSICLKSLKCVNYEVRLSDCSNFYQVYSFL